MVDGLVVRGVNEGYSRWWGKKVLESGERLVRLLRLALVLSQRLQEVLHDRGWISRCSGPVAVISASDSPVKSQ